MKKKGAVFEFTDERNDDLLSAYCRQLASCSHIRASEIFKRTVEMPSRRFWVSERRAAAVIASIIKGNSLTNMGEMKKAMFREIYRRVMRLRETNPTAPLIDLCSQVVNQRAPKFYLTPGSAEVIICKARKEWFEKRRFHMLRYLPR